MWATSSLPVRTAQKHWPRCTSIKLSTSSGETTSNFVGRAVSSAKCWLGRQKICPIRGPLKPRWWCCLAGCCSASVPMSGPSLYDLSHRRNRQTLSLPQDPCCFAETRALGGFPPPSNLQGLSARRGRCLMEAASFPSSAPVASPLRRRLLCSPHPWLGARVKHHWAERKQSGEVSIVSHNTHSTCREDALATPSGRRQTQMRKEKRHHNGEKWGTAHELHVHG